MMEGEHEEALLLLTLCAIAESDCGPHTGFVHHHGCSRKTRIVYGKVLQAHSGRSFGRIHVQ